MSTFPLPEPSEPATRTGRPGPFAPLRDIFVAPARAYAALLARPSWLPAFAIVVAASVVYLTLVAPALAHLTSVLAPPGKAPSAAEIADTTRDTIAGNLVLSAFGPLFAWSFQAMVFTTIARLKSQPAPFAVFFALCAVCSLPAALGNLVDGAGIAVRDVHALGTWKALVTAVPDNLAIFASPKNDREVAFLANFSLFETWSSVLLAFGFAAAAKVRTTTALLVTFGLDIVLALTTNQLFSA